MINVWCIQKSRVRTGIQYRAGIPGQTAHTLAVGCDMAACTAGKGRGPTLQAEPEILQTPHILPYGLMHSNVNYIDVLNSVPPSVF